MAFRLIVYYYTTLKFPAHHFQIGTKQMVGNTQYNIIHYISLININ